MATHTYDDALFRAQFPAFANTTTYPEALLSGYFDMAVCYINAHDHCRLYGDCLQLALNLLTAHLAALFMADPSGGGGTGIEQSATVDKVSVSYQIPPAAGPFRDWLNKTGFGQQLSALLSVKSVGGWYIGGSMERAAFRKAGGYW